MTRGNVKMQRGPGGNGDPGRNTGAKIARVQALSALVSRMELASKLGLQYGGDRDIYQALGYPDSIAYSEYYARYKRQDIARAVIDRPVNATWSGELKLVEGSDDKQTSLEKAWNALNDKFHLKSRFTQLDKLTSIGHYGVLLLGLDDVKNKEDYAKPVLSGKRKLTYLKARGEKGAEIASYEIRSASERYGLPHMYKITTTDTATGNTVTVQVHHTRVIHIVDGALENEVEGAPRLESIWNRLLDLEKVVGGSAEMFWRGARPGYHAKLKDDFQLTKEEEDELQDQIDEYEHKLRRIITTAGLDELRGLAMQVSDPKGHVDVLIQMISAVTGIPKRILTGSERGELASTQDKESWLSYIQTRREEFAEVQIVRAFVNRCIELGILPPATEEGYTIQWEDLFSMSEKERVEVGKSRAEAIAKYASSPMAEGVIPPDAFVRYCLGLPAEDIAMIFELIKAGEQELQVTEEERKILEEEE